MSRVSLRADLYMNCEDQIFVANTVDINSIQETMVTSVISRPTSVAMELNTIVKICNYKRFREGHHFISMVMEMHSTLVCNMHLSSRNALVLWTIDDCEVICLCPFTISISGIVLIMFFSML
jgi:hypothetical protein